MSEIGFIDEMEGESDLDRSKHFDLMTMDPPAEEQSESGDPLEGHSRELYYQQAVARAEAASDEVNRALRELKAGWMKTMYTGMVAGQETSALTRRSDSSQPSTDNSSNYEKPIVREETLQQASVNVEKMASSLPPMLANKAPQVTIMHPQGESEKGEEIRELVAMMRMPQATLPKFKGQGRAEFWTFMHAFRRYMTNAAVPEKYKYQLLMDACEGEELHQAIMGCDYLEPDRAYNKAIKILEERFGDKYAYADQLVKLASQLWGAVSHLENLNLMSELETWQTFRTLVIKLPPNLRERCVDDVRNYQKSTGHRTGLVKWLALYLEEKAVTMDDMALLSSEDNQEGSKKRPEGSSSSKRAVGLVTISEAKGNGGETNSGKGSCLVCSRAHGFAGCDEFRSMSLRKRHLTIDEKCQDCTAHSECEDSGKGLTPTKSHQNFSSLGLRQRQVLLHQRSGTETKGERDTYPGNHGYTCPRDDTRVSGGRSRSGWRRHETTQNHTYPESTHYTKFPTTLHNSVANTSDISRSTHLRGVELPELQSNNIEILIGQDVPQALVPLEVRAGRNGMPFAIKTRLGWTVNGPVGHQDAQGVCMSGYLMTETVVSPETRLERQVKLFWELESGDTGALQSAAHSLEDKRVLRLWSETGIKTNGHYQFPIPFRNENTEIPNNKAVAERRLDGLRRRLSKDARLRQGYVEEINKLLAEGYAESVPKCQLKSDTGLVWYLPHHPVLNPNKSNKVRIVFDCAAKHKRTSLNDQVLQGPDFNNKLLGICLGFAKELQPSWQMWRLCTIKSMKRQNIEMR
ncbi:uncharacterized protein LOC121880282 [Homarus americanus]|uniref:uncharacterized protein LOC121880282 n=1 Tax=Homarus americanus TaxID=6706 RepID=UPI001C482C2C|nr:uncharacterized protein LOC121880282 [Homarus americanus]